MRQPSLDANLARLPRAKLIAMHDAAHDAVSAMRRLAGKGRSVLTETLAGSGREDPGSSPGQPRFEEWAHYPHGDIFDAHGGGLAYYHAHAARERVRDEHGHFHLFASPHRAPVGTRRSFVHLLGVSLDAQGLPIRLFTTNRWVTDESWRDAPAVLRLATRFELSGRRPSRSLNRWLSALPTVFRPQLESLLAARDARVAARVEARRRRREESLAQAHTRVLEDRSLHVLSQCPVDLYAQVIAIERALEAKHGPDSGTVSPAGDQSSPAGAATKSVNRHPQRSRR